MHLSLQIIVVLVISPEEIRGNSSHPVQCRPDSYFKSSRLSVNIKCLSMLPTITDFLKNIWLCFLAWSSLCQHRKPNPPGFYDLTDKVTWILFPISGWAILYSSGKPKLNLWNYNNGSRRNISPYQLGDVLRANLTFLRLCVFNQFRSIYVIASAHAAKNITGAGCAPRCTCAFCQPASGRNLSARLDTQLLLTFICEGLCCGIVCS